MSYNWENKKERAQIAYNHTREMEERFHNEILNSINNSIIYTNEVVINPIVLSTNHCRISLLDMDSVSAIINDYDPNIKTAVLNFASYKEPGGMFLQGSRAQEECLCHESFLYNVLNNFRLEYYDWNNYNKNRGLYKNRAIYSPDIIFERGNNIAKCDVITCAAPNKNTAMKYQGVSEEVNNIELYSRIKFILDIASDKKVKRLILGAFGCGVFGQDPYIVAKYFKELLYDGYMYNFTEIIFAIPNTGRDINYDTFMGVIYH